MKSLFKLGINGVVAAYLLHVSVAHAQGPTIDPTFQVAHIYNASSVRQAIEQPDGKRLLLGEFTYLNGTLVGQLVRLLPSGALDAAFTQNLISSTGNIKQIALLPNGKIMLVPDNSVQVGSISRRTLMRLNADGTPDASFIGLNNVYTTVNAIAIQPDGKMVVAGTFFAGGAQIDGVNRLEADGTMDASFQANNSTAIVNSSFSRNSLAIQPDGKILVAGHGLTRILPDGSPDASFSVVRPPSTQLQTVAMQADGKILVMASSSTAGVWPPLTRLLPDGTVDSSFNTGSNFNAYVDNTYGNAGACLAIQPDGKILVTTKATSYNGTPIGHVVRLLANGSLDTSFANTTAALDQLVVAPTWLQILANGQLLVAGPRLHYAPANSSPTGIAVLNANGTRDTGFLPRATQWGSIADVALQPDGKYIVGGSFTEINGTVAENLARLQADGSVDNAFTQAAVTDATVNTVLLQADGKVLVGGPFKHIAGVAQTDLARLLPTGGIDAAFAPGVSLTGAEVAKLAVQPDGNILVARKVYSSASPPFIRIDGQTGQTDASFQPGASFVSDCVAQADGSIIAVGANTNNVVMWRMLPNGTIDPSFTQVSLPVSSRTSYSGRSVSRDALGRWCLVVSVADPNGVAERVLRRMPDGSEDTSFRSFVPLGRINCVTAQPNNRIIVGGLFSVPTGITNLSRLLESGVQEPSFLIISSTGVAVNRLLVQPDGKIMAAGTFIEVGGVAINGLTRLLDANVLSVTRSQSAARTAAWPVPTHENLNLQLDAAAHPQRVALLNGVGQVVLSVTVKQAEMTLPLAGVAPGLYLLQVSYADGIVTRRVIVE